LGNNHSKPNGVGENAHRNTSWLTKEALPGKIPPGYILRGAGKRIHPSGETPEDPLLGGKAPHLPGGKGRKILKISYKGGDESHFFRATQKGGVRDTSPPHKKKGGGGGGKPPPGGGGNPTPEKKCLRRRNTHRRPAREERGAPLM